MNKIAWLGLFDKKESGMANQTPARILQNLLENKWALAPGDKDMIVMQHQFEYMLKENRSRLVSSMAYIGKDPSETAMSITVGLPLAIATKLILQNKISLQGVQIPIHPRIYNPVLDELENYGIRFIEEKKHHHP